MGQDDEKGPDRQSLGLFLTLLTLQCKMHSSLFNFALNFVLLSNVAHFELRRDSWKK